MAAHVDHPAPEPTSGAALLPLFAFATIIAVIVIALVIAYPGIVTLSAAMLTVIGFAAGIVAMLSRLIGPDAH